MALASPETSMWSVPLLRFANSLAARRGGRPPLFGSPQGQHDLSHHRDGDLLRILRADVDANRRMDALQLFRREASRQKALGALGMVSLRTERADVETVRSQGHLERLVVDMPDVSQRHH